MRSRIFNTLAALSVALLLCSAAPATRAQATAAAWPSGGKKPVVVYTCPMHPEVKSKKKGSCPKCKMDLRPASAEAQGVQAAGAETPSAKPGGRDAHASHAHAKMTIPDVELLDQDGRKVRFYTDIVKGKTVAVNFVFTTCTTICPPLGATFARLQKELGARAGRDVRLVSISVDPATDTPERLKAWGAKFHAAEGWTLVTGRKPQVDELLRALGAGVASPADHTPTVLIGNDAAGQWTRAYGLARPAVLIGLIDAAAAGRLDAAAASNSKESAR
ncbi:MAG TPA: SCO family protein [Pyrinomonadaceae bacterium]